jgi:outer membrane protein assembly factor BamB/tetratricopeptide (TPR) repeat protein
LRFGLVKMKTLHLSLCLFAWVAAPALLGAQEPAAVRKVVLPSLDSQVAARLIALDRRRNPVHSPRLAASVVAQLVAPTSPLDAFTPILADPRNQEIWEQLPEEYYRMTQESGDTLVTLPEAAPALGVGLSSGQVRRLCHQRLAALPRASLELYRQRVDAEAKALLEQGRQSRSFIPLRRLVDELFCSAPGDQALDLLGDLSFEKGQFEEARHWWSLLAPLDGVPCPRSAIDEHGGNGRQAWACHPDRLLFPHPKLDLARVQAKQVLALIFQGRLNEAKAEISRFIEFHPRAKGKLAGQDDYYGAILQKTLESFEKQTISNNEEPWTTFGGDATRNRTLSQGLSWQLWEDGPAWRIALPPLSVRGKDKPAQIEHGSLLRRVAFHPVIVNHQILIADHRSVVSYQLITGKELFRYDLKTAGLIDPGPGIDAKVPLPRFTLSVDQERAYVRLGRLGVMPGNGADANDASYLVCLDLTSNNATKQRELWHVRANGDDKSPAFFEGSPLVHDGRVYIALSKVVGRRVVTSIVCYDVQGRRRWVRAVCDCPEFEENNDGPRFRQHLLTWAGGQIVYCSHAGAIVAVDARTGQPSWGVRYPSRGPMTPEHEPSPRDLTPCLYADGRVYSAPLDTDRLFCLDAVTGRSCWEQEGVEIVHLLGVAQGRLYATTRNGLAAINAATGQTEWTQPSEGRLPSLGRGLLAGGWLIWPTQDPKLPYRAVTLRSGNQQIEDEARSVLPEPPIFDPTMLHTLPVGNLAHSCGCLAIAGLNELVVYVPAHKIKQLPPKDGRPQAGIESLYKLARQQASAGQSQKAARTYRELLEVTKAHPRAYEWRALIEARLNALTPAVHQTSAPAEPTRDELIRRAERSLKEQRYGESADAYRRLLALPLPADRRARALLGLARAYEGQRDYRSAWRTWTLLDAPLGDAIEMESQKPYRELVPSTKKEPYLSAFAPSVRDRPGLPLVRAWSHEDGRVWPTDGDDHSDDYFFCTQPGRVTCRTLMSGEPLWRRNLDFEPTWFGRWRDLVLISGPDAVQALRVHDGQSAWSFPAPSRRWRLGSVRDGIPKVEPRADGFVHAELWDDTLLLLDDHRSFYRLRLDSGQIKWQYASAAAPLRPLDAAAFSSHFTRLGNRLWIQCVTGQPFCLCTKHTPCLSPSRPWLQAPQRIGNAIVLAGEGGRIFGQGCTPPHARLWTYQAQWPTSLTGELCRLYVNESVLLALVPRNAGYECIRVDPAKGTVLWSVPAGRFPDDLDVSSLSIGSMSFFYVRDGKLHARSLNDGSLQWTKDLPARSARWRLRYANDYLAVYPAEAPKGSHFHIGFIDPWDGRCLQRLAFPNSRGIGEVVLTPRRLLVSSAGKIFGFRSLDAE